VALLASLRRVKTENVLVTVALATKWLEGNTHNRPVRDSRVHQYANDMKEGRWGVSHQGIAFAEDGTLLDGQHRLWAILEAKVPIEMMVTTGLPMDAQKYIDEGLPRSVVDVMKLDGQENISAYRAAVARRMLIGTRTQVILSRQEQIDFIHQHEKAINFVVDEVFQGKKKSRVMPAPVGATLARAYYHEDRDRLKEFGQILLGDMPKGPDDSGAHLLCQWLMANAPEHGQRISREVLIYMKSQRAILAFCKREHIRTLYLMKDEQYPLATEARRSLKTRSDLGKQRKAK